MQKSLKPNMIFVGLLSRARHAGGGTSPGLMARPHAASVGGRNGAKRAAARGRPAAERTGGQSQPVFSDKEQRDKRDASIRGSE